MVTMSKRLTDAFPARPQSLGRTVMMGGERLPWIAELGGLMETVDVIRKRRSVRAFSDRPVSRELLESLVEAACWAPTASNVQAWRFCVADDPDLVRKLDMVSPGLSGKPPVIVVALSDRDYARAKGGAKAADEFAALDVAYACENLMLAAADGAADLAGLSRPGEGAASPQAQAVGRGAALQRMRQLGCGSGNSGARSS